MISGVDTSDFPRSREPSDRYPLAKYPLFLHSELNALAQAAKNGHSVNGGKIYLTHMPCIQCLQVLWQAGVKEVVFPKGKNGSDSGKSSFGLDSEARTYYDLIFRATEGQLIIREV
jgi:deoxycytidylate deaminase